MLLTLVAGIDECGYGPLLGPLIISSSIFLVQENPEANMWTRLQKSIGKKKKGLGNRILVTDSKKAYKGEYLRRSKVKVNHLEQTARAFLNQLHLEKSGELYFASILPVISNDLTRQYTKYPWYLPLYSDFLPRINQTISDTLIANMLDEGIEFVDFRCLCIDVEEFNRIVDSSGNKATAVTTSVLKLIRQIIAIAIFCCAKKIVIYCDRLGGRKFYAEMLNELPFFKIIEIVEESNKISKYKLSDGRRELDIQFEVKADDKRLPVALASMVGKYIREKVMQHMNDYFVKSQPGLKPTAGYWVDGWRFIVDLEDETLDKAGLEREDLVRIK